MTNTTTQNSEIIFSNYLELLDNLKEKIRSSQVRASISVNTELVILYWEIGTEIVQRQKKRGVALRS